MTPCTCHPGNDCASEASCAAARRVEFGDDMTTTPAMPELHRDQIIDLISPLSKNSADHDIEFAHRVIAALQSAQPAAPQGVIAWAHPDGRVVPASTKEQAIRDGGAMASSLAGYTIPCVAAQPAAAGVSDDDLQAIDDAHNWQTLKGRMAAYRAILALRPQAVPMTIEQMRAMLTEAGYDDDIDEARGDFINGIRYAEAHYGITAQGAQGELK